MLNKYHLKTIEDIAIQYLSTLQPIENNNGETINTVEDKKLSIKGATSIGGSFYCRTNKFFDNENYIFFRKIPQKNLNEDDASILTSDTEYSSSRNTIHNSSTVIKLTHTKIFVKKCQNLTYSKKIFFPLKYDIVYDCLSGLYLPLITNLEDLNNLRNYMNDTKNRIEYFSLHESIFNKKIQMGKPPNPLSQKIDDFFEEEKCCEICEFSLILFILHLIMGAKIKHTEFINDEDMESIYGEACFVLDKLRENIMLKLLYNDNYKNENNKNSNIINTNSDIKSGNNISFESVCNRYIKEYFKGIKKTQKNIITDLNNNLEIIFQRLYNAINILLLNFTKVKIYTNNVNNPDEIESYFLELLDYNFPQTDEELISQEEENNIINEKDNNNNNQIKNNKEIPLQKEFLDQYEVFKEMFYFLTHKEPKKVKTVNEAEIKSDMFLNPIQDKDKFLFNDKTFSYKDSKKKEEKNKKIKSNITNPKKNTNLTKDNKNSELISEKTTLQNNSSFYTKLKYYFNLYFSNFTSLLEKNKVNPPFLPKLDKSKYKYTLVLDLDETLVHYVEEENSAYVQVRPYADYFLKELSQHFEIVLFTAAEEDYTAIVLNELNKNNYITHILCRKYTEFKNGCYIKDLSKLGRDLNKVCIVDNNKDNFSLQPENGLCISSYYGEQNDNELYILCADLKKIIEIQPDDIRTVIKKIDEDMQNRYNENYAIQ